MLSSGFTNASVSKLLVFGITASSILVSITDSKYLFSIQVVPHLWRYKQAWRLLLWQVSFPFLPSARSLNPAFPFYIPECLTLTLDPMSLGVLHKFHRGPLCSNVVLPHAHHRTVMGIKKIRRTLLLATHLYLADQLTR